jgi:hypothetical protein
MQEQKVTQMFTKSSPKGTAAADVRRRGNKDAAGPKRVPVESTDYIYRSIFGDVS